uniref:Uncharacterized protein n=1 Tax=Tanacetum cinerariifolium TaxID=118510 RepID=A0A699HHZ5_TANCI|nr:hypothetical protein [Tanacetum cinerariifolium]
MDNWPPGPSNLSPSPRSSHPPPQFEHPPPPQPLYKGLKTKQNSDFRVSFDDILRLSRFKRSRKNSKSIPMERARNYESIADVSMYVPLVDVDADVASTWHVGPTATSLAANDYLAGVQRGIDRSDNRLGTDFVLKNNMVQLLRQNCQFHGFEGEDANEHLDKKNTDSLNTKITKLNEALSEMLFPPLAQVYSLPKKDMSWTRLPEFADDTITDYSRPSPSVESNSSDLQNTDSPTVIKTNKAETARKPPVRYAEMYRNTSKSPKVRGKNWSKNNFAYKNVTPRADLFKTASVSAARRVNAVAPRPNVNSARPKTTQDLVIIKLIQRVKRLERELKARTPPTKIQKVDVRGTKLEDSVRTKRSRGTKSKEMVDYILQVKKKLLIKKPEDSEAEHQV